MASAIVIGSMVVLIWIHYDNILLQCSNHMHYSISINNVILWKVFKVLVFCVSKFQTLLVFFNYVSQVSPWMSDHCLKDL